MNTSFTIISILLVSLCTAKTHLRGSAVQSESFNSVLPTDASRYSTIQDQLTLKRGDNGFSVSINLSNVSDTNSSNSTADMIIALYTNNTVLFNYNCSDYKSCHIDPSFAVDIDLPYFSLNGQYASLDASLNMAQWKLSTDAIVNTNDLNNSNTNSTAPHGFIGLGQGGNASANFLNQPSFSIFLSSAGDSGQLLFTSPNMSLADSADIKATLFVDDNWHVHGVNSVDIGSGISVENTSLIFDVNSDTIGLPLPIYNQVLEALETQYGLLCSSDMYYRPVCSNDKLKKMLPDLTINIGDQRMSLPYNVYVEGGVADTKAYEIVLNFKALASNLTGESYVTPTYENYIILNYHVMAYYYTVFDGDNQTIVLYVANHSEDMNYILFIIMGWFGLFVMVAIFYYCYMKRKIARSGSVDNNVESQNSVQDPLLGSSEPVEEMNNQMPHQQQHSFSQG